MVYKLYSNYFRTKWTQPFPVQAPLQRRKSAESTVPHRWRAPTRQAHEETLSWATRHCKDGWGTGVSEGLLWGSDFLKYLILQLY